MSLRLSGRNGFAAFKGIATLPFTTQTPIVYGRKLLVESEALLIKPIRKYGCQANSSSFVKVVNRFTNDSGTVHQKQAIELTGERMGIKPRDTISYR